VAVMLGMATRAVLPAAGVLFHVGMKTPACLKPLPDLAVTAQALQPRSAGPESVTGDALSRTAEMRMCTRQGSRRDLAKGRSAKDNHR
jgi:hypothetical protein